MDISDNKTPQESFLCNCEEKLTDGFSTHRASDMELWFCLSENDKRHKLEQLYLIWQQRMGTHMPIGVRTDSLIDYQLP